MATDKKCSCGSGLLRTAQYDGYGIFLTYACAKCVDRKMARFRPDIRTR